MRKGLIAGSVVLALLAGGAALGASPAKPPAAGAKKPPPAKKPPTKKPAPATPQAQPPGPALDMPPEAALQQARKLSDAGDSAGAYALLSRLVASPAFATLAPNQQHAARYLLGGAAMNTQKYPEAHAAFRGATEGAGATGMDWFARGATASAIADDADTIYSLTRLAKDFPAAIILAGDDTVSGALAAADRLPDGPERRFALMEALFDAHWRPKDAVSDFGDDWRRYAIDLLAKGQDKRAAAVVLSRVADTDSLVLMRADRRFDTMVAANAARFDVAAAAGRDLTAARSAVIAEPLRLAPINAQAAALLRLGRPADGLTLLEDALIRALPDIGESPYRDQAEVRITLDLRARALMALGRRDEAEAGMKRAAALYEHGAPNVTQVTALAWMQLRLGKPRDALSTLAGLSGGVMAPSQIQAAEAAQACALKGVGDAAGAQKVLADMRTRKEAPDRLVAALVCLGDLDAAAGMLTERLADPNARAALLAALQDYVPAGEPTPVDKDWAGRRKALVERPAVQKALTAVGRIGPQPVTAPLD
jgi:tetratricopeptide (TPR) repeat protein